MNPATVLNPVFHFLDEAIASVSERELANINSANQFETRRSPNTSRTNVPRSRCP